MGVTVKVAPVGKRPNAELKHYLRTFEESTPSGKARDTKQPRAKTRTKNRKKNKTAKGNRRKNR